MNQYVTGPMIRRLRDEKKMTQLQLASVIGVSDKSVSKWENGRGYPDISLLEPLAAALGVSVTELLAGENTVNTNRSFNMNRIRFYVCPVCGNILLSTGETVISCHGIALPALEAETPDGEHYADVAVSEDDYFVTVSHEMSRQHHISFIAAVRDDGAEIIKLYPEGNAETRLRISKTKKIYFYCNRHGLFETDLKKRKTRNKQ